MPFLLTFDQMKKSMITRTATIIGGTGLIGSQLWELLKNDSYYDTIRLLVRRPFIHNDPKTEVKLVDFSDRESLCLGIYNSHAVFCAIGTTMKKVGGDKEAYRKIDYDIAVHAAQCCEETGCSKYLLVSSVGASTKSKNFYLNLKGEIEEKISTYNIPSICIFRPSMLLGSRNESRIGERIGQIGMQALSALIPSKYKPIKAEDVAKSMIANSKKSTDAITIYEYREMQNL